MRARRLYATLRERVLEECPAYDDEAERCALGALFLAPARHAKRIAKKLWREHFYLEHHAWLWERASCAVGKSKDWDDPIEVHRWLRREKILERYYKRFSGPSLVGLVESCMEAGFWWHGIYYCDRVIAAAKVRGRVKRAAGDLAECLNRAEDGWHRRDWT